MADTHDDSLTHNGDGDVEYAYDDLHRLTKEQCVPAEGASRPAHGGEYWHPGRGAGCAAPDGGFAGMDAAAKKCVFWG